jgi:ABC-type dipeptide/oligopeptide/nickel transport system permease component
MTFRRVLSTMNQSCIILIAAFALLLSAADPAVAVRGEKRCGSVDIRNNPKMAFQPRHASTTWMKYKECTILEGDFTISMITQANVTDDMFPVFENLREITGSVLVFQIR